MIQATNIVKRFGELEVLRGVDLTVNAGEIVSIVGASGAGKTTLLQILGTLDLPDAGEVSIGGQSTAGLSRRELSAFRNAHLGFVFQFHRLLPEFNALENVLMPAWIAGKSTAESRVRARQLLEELGMAIMHNRITKLIGLGLWTIYANALQRGGATSGATFWGPRRFWAKKRFNTGH